MNINPLTTYRISVRQYFVCPGISGLAGLARGMPLWLNRGNILLGKCDVIFCLENTKTVKFVVLKTFALSLAHSLNLKLYFFFFDMPRYLLPAYSDRYFPLTQTGIGYLFTFHFPFLLSLICSFTLSPLLLFCPNHSSRYPPPPHTQKIYGSTSDCCEL